jgi:hypothetical protein
MVVEMAILCFAPRGNADLLFGLFLANRVLSGAAEAAASGADEALAYDSLKQAGMEAHWGQVLEAEMRYRSIAFIGAMSLGAAVYDPALMQRAAEWFGLGLALDQGVTLRFPPYLTLLMAILTLAAALGMREATADGGQTCFDWTTCRASVAGSLRITLQAGAWIWRTPFALVVIMAGMLFDHVIRMVITLASEYYRLIDLPEASFGLIGSGLAMLGLFVPRLARSLEERRSPGWNLGCMSVLSLAGLAGMALFVPVAGILPAVLVFSVMYFNHFFTSTYLNRLSASHQRATVLSFKGLSFNLAYGLIGVLYSLQLAYLRQQLQPAGSAASGEALEDLVFMHSLGWFPWYFLALLAVLLIFARWRLSGSRHAASA